MAGNSCFNKSIDVSSDSGFNAPKEKCDIALASDLASLMKAPQQA